MKKFASSDVSDIRLLTLKEAKLLPREVLDCGTDWWLNTPGHGHGMANVNCNGIVFAFGTTVDNDNVAVRPAFILDLKSSDLGDIIEVAGIEAIVISDTMALAKKPVGHMAFRKDWSTEDSTDYKKSDVKIWLEDWWERQTSETK